MATFVLGDGTRFELVQDRILLGRGDAEPNDPHKFDLGRFPGGHSVSHRHAMMHRHASRWYLQVEGQTTNDTFLEGFAIPRGTEVPLSDGDRVRLGEVVLTFRGPSFEPAEEEQTLGGSSQPLREVPPLISTGATRPIDWPDVSDWVARLPDAPGVLEATGVTSLQRINAFPGLMVDESTWRDEHDYHQHQARIHALAGHGWGIIDGLEVVADASRPDGMLVRPGLAVDAHGRTLVLAQAAYVTVPLDVPAVLYVVVSYAEEPTAPQRGWSDRDECTRVVERAEVHLEWRPPALDCLELARLRVDGRVRDARDPTLPRSGELDMRYRERVTARPKSDLRVAQLVFEAEGSAGAAERHRVGLRYALREVGQSTPYRPRWAGAVRPDEALPPIALLYLTGDGAFSISADFVSELDRFLSAGGVLFADACRAGDWQAFSTSVEVLASTLGRALKGVTRGHPLLVARHVFAAPPYDLFEGGGVILTGGDYGCAWQGGSETHAESRELVRAAIELGTNAAVYARHRQHPLDALELDA